MLRRSGSKNCSRAALPFIYLWCMFENQVVWITGASSGIGEALAYAFARRGAKLILSARREQVLEKVRDTCLQKTPEVHILPFDLEDAETLEGICRRAHAFFQRIDVLVNNGGISQRALAEETPLSIDRKIMEINFFGNIALAKCMLPYMRGQRGGRIVVMNSMSGKFGWKQRTSYSASKFALQGFYESLRAEVSKYNIHILMVYPGRIRTEISLHALQSDGSEYKIMDPAQANGISPEKCAKKILCALAGNKKEIIIAGKERILLFIRRIFPPLYYSFSAKADPNKR